MYTWGVFRTLTQLAFTCLKLAIETLEQGVKRRSGIFIVNFEHISHLVLAFLKHPSYKRSDDTEAPYKDHLWDLLIFSNQTKKIALHPINNSKMAK